jgi:hypothetical protein
MLPLRRSATKSWRRHSRADGSAGGSRLHCGSARGPDEILDRVLCIRRTVFGTMDDMASYSVNPDAVAHARRLIDARQCVLDSD